MFNFNSILWENVYIALHFITYYAKAASFRNQIIILYYPCTYIYIKLINDDNDNDNVNVNQSSFDLYITSIN